MLCEGLRVVPMPAPTSPPPPRLAPPESEPATPYELIGALGVTTAGSDAAREKCGTVTEGGLQKERGEFLYPYPGTQLSRSPVSGFRAATRTFVAAKLRRRVRDTLSPEP